jgi:hypothetical protein
MKQGNLLLIIELIKVLASTVQMIPTARAKLELLNDRVTEFVQHGRNPTVKEFNEILAEARGIDAILQKAAERPHK